jgi:hypothetical protein
VSRLEVAERLKGNLGGAARRLAADTRCHRSPSLIPPADPLLKIVEVMQQLRFEFKEQLTAAQQQLAAAQEDTVLRVQEQTVLRMQRLLELERAAASPFSDTTLAHNVLQALRGIPSGIVDFTTGREGAPVLTEELQAALLEVAKDKMETGVVHFLTPFLHELCLPPTHADEPCAPVLMNSERLPWLVPPSAAQRRDLRLKPDLFLSWRPFGNLRGGAGGGSGGSVDDAGELGGYSLQQAGCVGGLFEAKRSGLGEAAFGELCGYHQCIRGECHGMLFDATSFQLYKSSDGFPISLVKSTWTSPGSAEVVRSFFSAIREPPLVVLLRELLKALQVSPYRVGGRCYLGSGAFGHVFTVGSRDLPTRPWALKVVLASGDTPLTHVATEFANLQEAAARDAPVVHPVADSLRVTSDGGGYLLESVGQPVRLRSLNDCTTLCASLAALHRAGVIHGDPRLPNVLVVGGELRWIDLLQGGALTAGASFEQLARVDAGILAYSILALGSGVPPPPAVADALQAYVVAGAAAAQVSCTALATAVWAARTAAHAAGRAAE